MSRPCLRSVRHVSLQLILAATLGSAVPLQAFADGVSIPRVRDTGNPEIAALLREAAERSVTFRLLVRAIEATDGIVYVEAGTCGHSVRACVPLMLTVAGPHRLLRVVVDLRRARDQVLAAIGHELQHAVEVLREPSIKTTAAMYYRFYDEGRAENGSFETRAALEAGQKIAHELTRR